MNLPSVLIRALNAGWNISERLRYFLKAFSITEFKIFLCTKYLHIFNLFDESWVTDLPTRECSFKKSSFFCEFFLKIWVGRKVSVYLGVKWRSDSITPDNPIYNWSYSIKNIENYRKQQHFRILCLKLCDKQRKSLSFWNTSSPPPAPGQTNRTY